MNSENKHFPIENIPEDVEQSPGSEELSTHTEYIHPVIGRYEKYKIHELFDLERKAKLIGALALFSSEIQAGFTKQSADWHEANIDKKDFDFEYAEKTSAMIVELTGEGDEENEVIAAADVRITYGEAVRRATLNAIAVAPEHQSAGLGGRLIEKAEGYARSQQADFMNLFASAKTDVAQEELVEWYMSHGYERTGQVREDKAVELQKSLYQKLSN